MNRDTPAIPDASTIAILLKLSPRMVLAIAVAGNLASACTNPSQALPQSAAAPEAWEHYQAVWLDWHAHQHGWRTLASGLQYRRVSASKRDALHPTPGCIVRINYEGRLTNGGLFDSSYMRGEPAAFPLKRLIKGWQEGVPLMRIGETWEFAVPPNLAYGGRAIRIDAPGETSIPANSALIFRIQLVGLGDDCHR